MATYIVAIHQSGGSGHVHIAAVVWVNESSMQSGIASTQVIIDFIRKDNVVMVSDGTRRVRVHVVDAPRPYIQTYADGRWTDNLLALPKY